MDGGLIHIDTFLDANTGAEIVGRGVIQLNGIGNNGRAAVLDGSIIVAFEDLMNGGDRDYNDNIFRFSGGVTVPEPGTLMLLGMGLLGMALGRLRRTA